MSSGKLIFLVPALLLIILNFSGAETDGGLSDGNPSSSLCTNCTICPYRCYTNIPPPPPPPPSGYPLYVAPPPPPGQAQGNCPPTPVVDCCNQQHPPPSPYGYVPYDNDSASTRLRILDRSVISVVFFVFFFFSGFLS